MSDTAYPDEEQFPLQIIPLGGASEIGKNMLAVRYEDDLVVVDAGVTFPGYDLPGIELILPDVTYLLDNARHLRAILLTHGHEDHIGALPFLLRRLQAPVYGTRLTLGLVRAKLDEHGLLDVADLREYAPRDQVELGSIVVEPIRVTHSIPDTVSLAFHTPVGIVVHTGDFKVDHTPVDGRTFDVGRFAQLGDEGVLLLISDTVNAEKPGWVPSEKFVGSAFDRHFREAEGRILATTFSSNIHRIQQFFDTAERYGRHVVVAGRSVQRNVRVARELGYLRYRENLVISVDAMDDYPPRQLAVLVSGSQGEPLSVLSQVARDRHRIHIQEGDTVILSSTPIPGNEEDVWRTVNRLIRLGARVVYDMITPVHASGHANQEELKLVYSLLRPLYVVPFHGEPRMMQAYTDMLTSMGVPRDTIIWLENGDRLGLDGTSALKLEPIPSSGSVLVDGLSSGTVSDALIRDRRFLALGGTVVVTVTLDANTGDLVSGPEFISRGFMDSPEADSVFTDAAEVVREALREEAAEDDIERDPPASVVHNAVARFLKKRTGGRPLVIPVVVEV